MSKLSDKIDDIHGIVHEMKPRIEKMSTDFERMEERLRGVENKCPVHDEKLKNLESDTGNIWKEVRKRDDAGGGWVAVLDFLAVLPKFWHVATLVGMLLAGVGLALWRHGK